MRSLLRGIISLLVSLSAGAFAQLDEGGPDGFGYCFETTQDPGDTVRFFWIEPVGHNLITGWEPNPDDGWAVLHLPFRFPFYGDSLDSLIICSNGFLQFPTTYTNYYNLPLPATQFNHLIALFWDDLNPENSGGVYYYYDTLSMTTIITWLDVTPFNRPDTISAQVILDARGTIRMNYLKTPRSFSATIGIQGNHGANNHFLQYLYNDTPPGHRPRDRTSVVFSLKRLEHDVGILRPRSPGRWFPNNHQCPVQAIIKNYGLNVESFAARAFIIRAHPPFDTVFNRTLMIDQLNPADTCLAYFGDYLTGPVPDSWYLLFYTDLPTDQRRRNDTSRTTVTSFPPAFGTVLDSWNLPALGAGMNLTGITYSSETNRFYVAVNDPNRIISFPPDAPQDFNLEPFQLQNFFGDDVLWGIAWDRETPGFWLTHVSMYGEGCIIARYTPAGEFTGDTWCISALAPGTWTAGIDQDTDGKFYAVVVGDENPIYYLDFAQKQLLFRIPGQPVSWRACAYLGGRDTFIISGGWNENTLVKLDTRGNVIQTACCPDLADLDIYTPPAPDPDSIIWAWATKNNPNNSLVKLSVGTTWNRLGTGESRPFRSSSPAPLPNPITAGALNLSNLPPERPLEIGLYDVLGRSLFRVSVRDQTDAPFDLKKLAARRLPDGMYILYISSPHATYRHKLILLNRTH